jgi:hypothetical protein
MSEAQKRHTRRAKKRQAVQIKKHSYLLEVESKKPCYFLLLVEDMVTLIASFCTLKERTTLFIANTSFWNGDWLIPKTEIIQRIRFVGSKDDRETHDFLEVQKQTKDEIVFQQRRTNLFLWEAGCCGYDDDDIPYDKYKVEIGDEYCGTITITKKKLYTLAQSHWANLWNPVDKHSFVNHYLPELR